jgi:hypothetical protein
LTLIITFIITNTEKITLKAFVAARGEVIRVPAKLADTTITASPTVWLLLLASTVLLWLTGG